MFQALRRMNVPLFLGLACATCKDSFSRRIDRPIKSDLWSYARLHPKKNVQLALVKD